MFNMKVWLRKKACMFSYPNLLVCLSTEDGQRVRAHDTMQTTAAEYSGKPFVLNENLPLHIRPGGRTAFVRAYLDFNSESSKMFLFALYVKLCSTIVIIFKFPSEYTHIMFIN